MAVIVLVHGIGQQQESADTLEAAWLPALAGGVRAAGFTDVADDLWRSRRPGGTDIRMAFFGDLFRQAGAQGGGGPGVGSLDLSDEGLVVAEKLAREWLDRVRERATSEAERDRAAIELVDLEGGAAQAQGGMSLARSAIASLARMRYFARFGMAFAERTVRRDLRQVTQYLTDDSLRASVLARVQAVLGPDTRMVVGHSLGSVVAYEAVHRHAHPMALLVTMGSPLGLRTVVLDRVRPPARYPSQVARWVNVADRDDVVAAAPDLSSLFPGVPPSCRFDGGYTVDNGAEPHSARFYLTSREVGRAIGETLAAA